MKTEISKEIAERIDGSKNFAEFIDSFISEEAGEHPKNGIAYKRMCALGEMSLHPKVAWDFGKCLIAEPTHIASLLFAILKEVKAGTDHWETVTTKAAYTFQEMSSNGHTKDVAESIADGKLQAENDAIANPPKRRKGRSKKK